MVSIYSIIYTAITLLSSVLYLCNGIYEDPSGNWHELDRAIILLIGIAAFELCTFRIDYRLCLNSIRCFFDRYAIVCISLNRRVCRGLCREGGGLSKESRKRNEGGRKGSEGKSEDGAFPVIIPLRNPCNRIHASRVFFVMNDAAIPKYRKTVRICHHLPVLVLH